MFCHRFRNEVAILLAVGWLIAPPHATAKPSSDSLFVAARSGDAPGLWSHLPKKKLKTARDEAGNTLLHEAALYGQAEVVEALLEAGLEVDATNDYGATPLLYGAGHLEVARALIEGGADVNARSDSGNTPLIVASSHPGSSRAAALLIREGADVNARNKQQQNALFRAVRLGGDSDTVRLLLAHGADVDPKRIKNDKTGEIQYVNNPLNTAAALGSYEIAQLLLAEGADPNGPKGQTSTAMRPLSLALAGKKFGIVRLLLEHGADAKFKAGAGSIPSMMWAAYDKRGRVDIAKMLFERGSPINQSNDRGETPLNWAEKRGPTPLRKFLIRHGAEKEVPTFKDKRIPNRNVPDASIERNAMVQDSVEQALKLLQKSSRAFFEQRNCVSCHQQTIPAIAFGHARDKGFPLKEAATKEVLQSFELGGAFLKNHPQHKFYELDTKPAIGSDRLGYQLWGRHALDEPSNPLTKALAFFMAQAQRPEGSWWGWNSRPPMVGDKLTSTALVLRGLQLYPTDGREKEIGSRIEKAAEWLANQEASHATSRAFQLLGLGWTGTFPEKRADIAAAILARQRSNGGWSQLPGLRSDAWATGLSLLALREGSHVTTNDRVYQRGVDFLLQTQFRDGSWWVASRSWPFQRHFDSRFPHGKDQWISAPATAWAAIALMATLDEYDSSLKEHLPPNRGYGNANRPTEEQDDYAAESKEISTPDGNITFENNILPLFKRSCAECHSGDDPKGEIRVTSKEALLEGGQSGDPALVPGKPAESKILRLVTDQVEDMEMPPLNKRDKFQRLSPKEIGLLRTWIQLGAHK